MLAPAYQLRAQAYHDRLSDGATASIVAILMDGELFKLLVKRRRLDHDIDLLAVVLPRCMFAMFEGGM
jgi:hypothetical protein